MAGFYGATRAVAGSNSLLSNPSQASTPKTQIYVSGHHRGRFPDILISEDTVFTWYESLAKDGFAPARRSPKSWDEEKGPKLVFSDPTQSIFLADMAGDGLSDIVRIRYSEVCYWPNLGYGRFGRKGNDGQCSLFLKAKTCSILGASILPISTDRATQT